ncbi:hypothetical protein J2R76_001819 [Bradyrhizobium sp. USDA 4532]|uniref:hypothetical protein n=1 Tax=Bradyrhizobium TaxID=374 RepID=UPI000977E2A2|nr:MULTISPECIES: hypothetical protein [Bradyrhizobium]MCP1833484.1 hypothetical protein [Bradyrhizobium sp. USDA 4545]MCP1852408.1 hypothetical protein [Bradyrhizobium sp. USDA 4541]MCP1918228.1 hypothetical protein [Bradyrhizobium sp. USDA 4532]OMI03157.1 hypothetical protein BSN85_29685 [Bradyrhizobium brasilense]
MRIAKLVFAGSLAAIAAIATPALGKSTERQKADDKSTTTTTSSGCQAYQQAADGTWNQLPCGEAGSNGATQHRPAAKGADDDEH